MKHIIDSEAVERLIVREQDKNEWGDLVQGCYTEKINIDDLRALLANSPQAVLSGQGLMVEMPQSDDVRKDADTIALEISRQVMQEIYPHTTPCGVAREEQLQAKIQFLFIEAIDKARKL